MGTVYKTDDGQVFQSSIDAQIHANNIVSQRQAEADASNAASRAQRSRQFGIYNEFLNFYNENNWSGLINFSKDSANNYWLNFNESQFPYTSILISIARAYVEDNYEGAFILCSYGEPYAGSDDRMGRFKIAAFKAGKQAWKKVHGREITDVELSQLKSENDKKFRATYSSSKSSSSRSSSYNEPRGIFPSIVFGFVGGVGLASIISWIAIQIVGPFSSNAFFLGFLALGAIITFIAWRNRKTMLLLVMLALSVGGWLFALGIIPEHVSATAKAKAAIEQTAE